MINSSKLYSVLFLSLILCYFGKAQTTLSLSECRIVMKGNAALSVKGDVRLSQSSQTTGFLSLDQSDLFVSGNLTANGSANIFLGQDFTRLHLIGDKQQLLSKNNASEINIESLLVNNPRGIKAQSDLIVNDTIWLIEGLLDLDGHHLKMWLNPDYSSSRAFGDAHPHPWISGENDKSYIYGGEISTEGNILASLISGGYDFANLGLAVTQPGLRNISIERGHTGQQIGQGESLHRFYNILTTGPSSTSGHLQFRFLKGDLPAYTNALGLQFYQHEIQSNGELVAGANWTDMGINTLDIASQSAILQDINTIYPMRWTLYECDNPQLHLVVEKLAACTGDSIRLSVDTEPGLQIEWSTGQTDPEIHVTSNVPGSRSVHVKVTALDGCFSVDTVRLNFTESPTVHFDHQTIESCLGTTLLLDPIYTGTHLQYQWSTGDTTAGIVFDVNTTDETTLSIRVAVDGECFDTDSVSIKGLAGPVVDLGPDTVDCTNSGIRLDPGSSLQSTYLWMPGQQTSPTLTVSQSGTYSVVVTNTQTQCSDRDTVDVAISDLFVTRSVDQPSCPGAADGAITLNIQGGIRPYRIEWNTGDTVRILTQLSAGKYSVTITDAVGCTKVFPTITIRDPKPLLVKYDLTHDLCRDGKGGIQLHPSGGTTPYDISWRTNINDAEYSSKDLSGLFPGEYYLSINDASNCSLMDTVLIEGPIEDLSVLFNTTNIQCEDNKEGRIEISQVNGGTAPYTYLWNTGATTTVVDSLTPGEYVVTITDDNDCSIVSDIISIDIIDSLLVHFRRTFPSCHGAEDGSLEVVTYGALPPLEILWSTGSTESKIENIPSGEYSVTVTDATGCVGYQSGVLAGPQLLGTQLDSIVHANCYNSDEGGIFLTTFGGSGTYTYDWSHDGPDAIDDDPEDLTDLKSGHYTLTITSSNNCVLHQSFVIEGGDSMQIAIDRMFGSCDGSILDGLSATVSGGASGYRYQWSNGDTTPALTNIPSGVYDLTVTDQTGCFAMATYHLDAIDELTVNLTIDALRCAGDSSAVQLDVVGGLPPYTFDWSDAITGIEQLAWAESGHYHVHVTDSRGCTRQRNFELSPLTRIQIERQVRPITSTGAFDGTISVMATGGEEPYTFNWSTGSTLDSITNLGADTYTVSVTDENGCRAVQSIMMDVKPAFVIEAEFKQPSCYNVADGQIIVQIENDQPPFSLEWSNGGSNDTIDHLYEGIYQLSITDAIGRDTVVNFQLSSEAIINYSMDVVNESCPNSDDGKVKIELYGDSPFDITIDDQSYTDQSSELIIDDLSPGIYPIQLSDGNQCLVSDTVVVAAALPIEIESEIIYAVDGMDGNGRIQLNATASDRDYRFQWSTGDVGSVLEGLESGNYFVTISDENGCTVVESFDLPSYQALNAEALVEHNQCGDVEHGEVDLSVLGGLPPYTFIWSNGDTTEDLTDLTAGLYTVLIEDDGGRSTSITTEVFTFDQLELSVMKNDVQCAGTTTGMASVEISGGIQPYTIQWSTGHDGLEITNLLAGSYEVTITDIKGCVATKQIEILDHPPLVLNKNVIGLSMVGASDGQISVSVDGGASPYTTIWSTGDVDTVISNLTEGWYEVLVVDQTGCAISDSTFIGHGFGGSEPLVLHLTATDLSCNGYMDGAVDLEVEGGESPYDYAWSNGASTQNISGLDGGTYRVTVTDAADSSIIGVIEVVEPDELKVDLEVVPLFCDGTTSGSITAIVSGGVRPYEYEWNTGDVDSLIMIDRADDYDVYVTDANDCDANADTTIIEPVSMDISITSTNIGCGGAETGSATVNIDGGLPPYDVAWSTGEQDESIDNLAPGTYEVTVVDANGCSMQAATTIEMSEGSVTARFLAASPVQAGDTVQFIDLSFPIPENWHWHFGDERGTTSTVSDPQFIYENDPSLDESHYDVTLIVENDGCVDSLTKTVRVINTRSGQLEPDPFLLPTVTRISTFEIYPNPTNRDVNIVFGLNQASDVMIELFSIDGRKIMTENIEHVQVNKVNLDTRLLAAGMYLVRLTADHDTRTLQLIKSN